MSSYSGLRSTTFRIRPYVPFENANRHSRAPVDILGHKMAQGTKVDECKGDFRSSTSRVVNFRVAEHPDLNPSS